MKKYILLLVTGFVVLYIIPLGFRPLVIPDEVRYAEIPREMIASGDWVVPRLNGLLYFEKPVMGYWLNGLAIKLLGENAFAVRITSALSAGLSALIVYFLTAVFFDSKRRGVAAAAVFLSFFLVYGLGVFSVLDGMFSFFLTSCIGFFYLAWANKTKRHAYLVYLILSGIFCGIAFLTKGFLAFAVPISLIVPFLVWEKNYKLIFKMSWIPILTALIVIFPWALLVQLRAPDFWHFFFWHEHVKRFFSEGAQHKESFFFFFKVLPVAVLPWTFLIPASISGLERGRFKLPFMRYAACWLIFPFILFSISSGKLSTYILPCFPALAILISTGLFDYLENRKTYYWFDKGVLVLSGMLLILMAALIVLQTGAIKSLRPFAYQDQWKGVLFFAALTLFIFILKKSKRSTDHIKKILLVAAAPLCFYFSAHFLLPDLTLVRKCPGELLRRNQNRILADTLIFSTESPVRAVNWFLKRNDVFVLGAGELWYGIEQKDAAKRLVDYEEMNRIILKTQGKKKIVFISDQGDYSRNKEQLPEPKFMDSLGKDGFLFIEF